MNYHKDEYFKGRSNILVFFIHGIFLSPRQFKPIYQILQQKGISYYTPFLIGHGKGLKELKKVSYKDWLNQVNDKVNYFSQFCDEIIIVGHSMGCLLALDVNQKKHY